MRSYQVALALGLCLIGLHASSPDIRQGVAGEVVDSYSAPIRSALVVIHSESQGTASVFSTDAAGRFAVDLPIGKFNVMATARSFSPICTRLEVTSGRVTAFNPKLRADAKHMED